MDAPFLSPERTLHTVDDALAGERLDTALRRLCPGLSLRAARRAIQRGSILLNDRPAPAATRLRQGQIISLPQADRQPDADKTACRQVRLLSRQGDYVCLSKPAGLHSVSLAGDAAPSLDHCCRPLLAALPAPAAQAVLLQRLDRDTSGLVCAALNEGAATAFRQAEAQGQCQKRYVALLHGALPEQRTADRLLDTCHRRQSRVLDRPAPRLRQTRFTPLLLLRGPEAAALLQALYPGVALPASVPDLTLAGCCIQCGARHQIRAHAAWLGFPLWGDPLYNPAFRQQSPMSFLLHHGMLHTPWGHWTLPPHWNLSPQQHSLLVNWLETPVQ